MEQEEAGELEVGDQPQLLLQALSGAFLVAVRAGVALCERALADATQLGVGRLLAVGEVGIAVAELLGQVELEPGGQLGRAGDSGSGRRGSDRPSPRVGGERTPRLPRRSRSEPSSVERWPMATSASWSTARRRLCECTSPVATVSTPSVSARSRNAALRRASPRSYGRWSSTKKRSRPNAAASREAAFGSRTAEAVAGAARETDEPVVAHRESGKRQRRFEPVVSVRLREQPAEVRVALWRLDEQRDVRSPFQGHLRARDRPHAEGLRRVRELERAIDAVVVGQRKRVVAELGSPDHELFRLRRPVEERIG